MGNHPPKSCSWGCRMEEQLGDRTAQPIHSQGGEPPHRVEHRASPSWQVVHLARTWKRAEQLPTGQRRQRRGRSHQSSLSAPSLSEPRQDPHPPHTHTHNPHGPTPFILVRSMHAPRHHVFFHGHPSSHNVPVSHSIQPAAPKAQWVYADLQVTLTCPGGFEFFHSHPCLRPCIPFRRLREVDKFELLDLITSHQPCQAL